MKVNILIAGGSGHWCEINHYPAILSLKSEGIESRVAVICDPINPYTANADNYNNGRKNLTRILKRDKPLWLDPERYTKKQLRGELKKQFRKEEINVAIVATDPANHYFYANLIVKNNINIICDKPLISISDSSWKIGKARQIEQKFLKLLNKVEKNKKLNSSYTFCTPLRRRALTPFVKIAESLNQVHLKTNQGVTHINAIISSGIHRYPVEFLKGGAHGFTNGIGSLSHSSYHYIDVIAWYLQSAPGKTKYIELTLPYVFRVKDYLKKQGYQKLMELNENEQLILTKNVKLTDSILNAELDFTIHMSLFDESNNNLGLFSYTSNHTTYTPREAKYNPNILDHANEKSGGRMSQVYFNIHQGALQNWTLTKNDVVFEGNNIEIAQRLHPKLGNQYFVKKYEDAYDNQTITPKDLFISFVKKSMKLSTPKTHDKHMQSLETQRLTHRIFSASYELMAKKYTNPKSTPSVRIAL